MVGQSLYLWLPHCWEQLKEQATLPTLINTQRSTQITFSYLCLFRPAQRLACILRQAQFVNLFQLYRCSYNICLLSIMTSHLFFAVQAGIHYHQLKQPLTFASDRFGLSNWLLRFPLSIYSADLKEKHVFTEDKVSIETHSGGLEEERWKYLVVTQQDGRRLYCTAQVYYERTRVKGCLRLGKEAGRPCGENQEFYLPKCLVFLSEEPLFKMQVNLLKIFRQLRRSDSIAHPTAEKEILQYKACKMSGEDYIPPAREGSRASCDMVVEYYLAQCNGHRGQDSVLLQRSDNTPVLHLYRLKQLNVLQLSHFFNLPLSNKTLACALTAILLEKQLIVTSRSSNLNVMVIQSLLQLLRPLKWEHMLVHNLPPHLTEAANYNFMPFIVGVNKRELQGVDAADRFVLVVDEDRILKPETLPLLELEGFPAQGGAQSVASHLAEKEVLQYSIGFMCNLLEPLIRKKSQIPSKNRQFYSQFKDTTLCDSLLQRYESGQLKDFARLLAVQDPEQRKQQIQSKLNELVYNIQHPKMISNEAEWLDYYLAKTQLAEPREAFSSRENRLKQKENKFVNNNTHRSIRRILVSSSRQHSTQGWGHPRSIQRLKVSMVRQDKRSPLIAELLEYKLGGAIRIN